MSISATSTFEEWQDHIQTLPTIGEQWIATCSRWGNPLVLSDTLGAKLKSKSALTGSILIARRMKKISPEQNVGLLLPTTAGGMLANMACMLLGKTAINLNYTASLDTILSAISQSEIKTVYSSSRFLSKLEEHGFDVETFKQRVNVVALEEVASSASLLEKTSTLLLCKILPTHLLQKLFCTKHDLDTTAVILFSSGSEGNPKGVILSHRNLLTNVQQIVKLLDIKNDDLILANLPLFHAFGLTVTLFMPLLHRAPVICHPDPKDVYTCAKTIEEHKASLIFGTSSFYRLYIRNNKVQPHMLDSLRLVVAGAEKLQKEVVSEFKAKFNKIIYEGYGTTETSPVAGVNIPQHLSTLEHSHRAGSVGLPLPGTNFKIVDPDSFKELPTESAGMILISGGQVMQGYLNNEKKSAEVLTEIDGRVWYSSGDKGYLDADGFLFIQDRYSRFAKIAGEMVGLGTIEVAIKEIINDPNLEVAAVNIPDSKKGEKVVVLSTQILDSSDLRTKLSAAGLSKLALPSSYVKVDTIPCLGSGKTDFTTVKKIALKITS